MTVAEPVVRHAWRLDEEDDIGILWFDLPDEKLNKFTPESVEELDRILGEIAARSSITRVLIASGKESGFIAGADISRFQDVPNASEAAEFVRYGQSVFTKLSRLPQMTFAVIHGVCMGGGTEMALNCDYRLITDWEKSMIALPEVKLGIIPAWTGTTRLPRIVGLPAALDMILTGKNIRAKKAKGIGLVDDVIPASIRMDAARTFARRQSSKKEADKSRIYVEGNPLSRKVIFDKARSGVMKQTLGNYPAPLRAIEVMKKGFEDDYEAGLEAEARAASELITGDVAPHLVRLFFMMEAAKRHEGPDPAKVDSVGVLGAGLMGGGIAQTLVEKANLPVRVRDISWDALAGGMRAASKIWKKKVEKRRLSRREMQASLAKITMTTDWTGFRSVDVVIEAVVEKLEIKQSVLREVESVGKPGVIFATNTSTIPITRIAEAASHPENVIGMHFFSPVDKMPLVEVIVGEKTSPETVSTIHQLGKRMGKTVVICKDGPGFIVNRILAPYINEAGFLLIEENSIGSIDGAMTDFGMPLGPLALLDEVGIDIAAKSGQIMMEAFGDRMEASPLVETLVADERYGKKNGRGIYVWDNGKRDEPDEDVYRLLEVDDPVAGDRKAMSERMILAMINEATRILDEGIAASAADVDLAMIMGTGFPPFRGGLLRYGDTLGSNRVLARLEALAKEHGKRFEPSQAIRRVAEKGGTFYQEWSERRVKSEE
ncbi:MAG: enoyl-CoA hydratase/isomerase family protein [Acidobacteria bacterium]|nr:enoyl-CoA hydratase/isomerase family protein [Acidobacteriota bacterium]